MNLLKSIFKYGIASAFAGIVCCVAPMILFQLGLIGGIYAISFADFFYKTDGSVSNEIVKFKIIYSLFFFLIINNKC